MDLTVTPQITCIICHDSLVGDLDSVGTQCGHLFHRQCLSKWFLRNMPATNFRHVPKEEMLRGTCPVCSAPQWMKRCLKIFPSIDDQEANDIKSHINLLKNQLSEAKGELGTANELIKKQGKAIAVLTKPKPSSLKEQRAVAAASVVLDHSQMVKASSIGSTTSKTKTVRNKTNVPTEPKNGQTRSLRSTTMMQRLVESTPSPSTVRRATAAAARSSATRTTSPSATSMQSMVSARRPVPLVRRPVSSRVAQ